MTVRISTVFFDQGALSDGAYGCLVERDVNGSHHAGHVHPGDIDIW